MPSRRESPRQKDSASRRTRPRRTTYCPAEVKQEADELIRLCEKARGDERAITGKCSLKIEEGCGGLLLGRFKAALLAAVNVAARACRKSSSRICVAVSYGRGSSKPALAFDDSEKCVHVFAERGKEVNSNLQPAIGDREWAKIIRREFELSLQSFRDWDRREELLLIASEGMIELYSPRDPAWDEFWTCSRQLAPIDVGYEFTVVFSLPKQEKAPTVTRLRERKERYLTPKRSNVAEFLPELSEETRRRIHELLKESEECAEGGPRLFMMLGILLECAKGISEKGSEALNEYLATAPQKTLNQREKICDLINLFAQITGAEILSPETPERPRSMPSRLNVEVDPRHREGRFVFSFADPEKGQERALIRSSEIKKLVLQFSPVGQFTGAESDRARRMGGSDPRSLP